MTVEVDERKIDEAGNGAGKEKEAAGIFRGQLSFQGLADTTVPIQSHAHQQPGGHQDGELLQDVLRLARPRIPSVPQRTHENNLQRQAH